MQLHNPKLGCFHACAVCVVSCETPRKVTGQSGAVTDDIALLPITRPTSQSTGSVVNFFFAFHKTLLWGNRFAFGLIYLITRSHTYMCRLPFNKGIHIRKLCRDRVWWKVLQNKRCLFQSQISTVYWKARQFQLHPAQPSDNSKFFTSKTQCHTSHSPPEWLKH